MVTPRWVYSKSPPIALEDLLEYLVRLPSVNANGGGIYDAGGPELLTYADIMRKLGAQLERKFLIIPVPVLTPRLSSYWLRLVTTVPVNIARALIDGLRHDVIADDAVLRKLVPLPLKTVDEAISAALKAERDRRVPAVGSRVPSCVGILSPDTPTTPSEP